MIRLIALMLWIVGTSLHVKAEDSWVHTRDVQALRIHENALWVATSGGIERYTLPDLAQRQHITLSHGLDSLDVLALEDDVEGLWARTAASRCLLSAGAAACAPTTLALPLPSVSGRSFQGAAVTAEIVLPFGRVIGTRGAGLWFQDATNSRRLTPTGQVCANHVQALASFRSELWVGGFREGLCVKRAQGFVELDTPFHFVNAMLSTHDTLYVAAHEGLFASHDGLSFERVRSVDERGINGLAVSGDTLLVTSAATLYRLPLLRGRAEIMRKPGGSLAIQSVSVHQREVWLATEDRGVLRIRGRDVQGFDALNGLASSWVLDVAVGKDGTAYAATLRDGLFAISRTGRVRHLATAEPWLLRLSFFDDTLLVGSQAGLLTLADTEEKPLGAACVHAILEMGDALWLGTESGLVAYPVEILSSARPQTALTRL